MVEEGGGGVAMSFLKRFPPPAEGVRHQQPDTEAVLAGRTLGAGTLYIAERCVGVLQFRDPRRPRGAGGCPEGGCGMAPLFTRVLNKARGNSPGQGFRLAGSLKTRLAGGSGRGCWFFCCY